MNFLKSPKFVTQRPALHQNRSEFRQQLNGYITNSLPTSYNVVRSREKWCNTEWGTKNMQVSSLSTISFLPDPVTNWVESVLSAFSDSSLSLPITNVSMKNYSQFHHNFQSHNKFTDYSSSTSGSKYHMSTIQSQNCTQLICTIRTHGKVPIGQVSFWTKSSKIQPNTCGTLNTIVSCKLLGKQVSN